MASDPGLARTAYDVCLMCGYSLRGLPKPHPCPECGFVTDLPTEQERVRALRRTPVRMMLHLINPLGPLPPAWWYTPDEAASTGRLRRVLMLVILILIIPTAAALLNAALVVEVEDVRTLNMDAVLASGKWPIPDPEERRRRRITFTFRGWQWYDYPPPNSLFFWDYEEYTFRYVESRSVRWFQSFASLGCHAARTSIAAAAGLLLAWTLGGYAVGRMLHWRARVHSFEPVGIPAACRSFGHVSVACAIVVAAVWLVEALGRVAFAGLWSMWWPNMVPTWYVSIAPCLLIILVGRALIRSDRARCVVRSPALSWLAVGMVLLIYLGGYLAGLTILVLVL